jgi:hypothetical protein
MQDGPHLTPQERELEAALGDLQPAEATMDRDRVFFLAGRASGRRRRNLWQAATASLAIALGISLGVRPEPREVERLVVVTRQVPAHSDAALVSGLDRSLRDSFQLAPMSYINLRREVLAHGLDVAAMRAPTTTRAEAITQPSRPSRQNRSGLMELRARTLIRSGEQL